MTNQQITKHCSLEVDRAPKNGPSTLTPSNNRLGHSSYVLQILWMTVLDSLHVSYIRKSLGALSMIHVQQWRVAC